MKLDVQHLLAVLAYRCAKCLQSAPSGYGDFQAGNGVKSPREILAHISDLMDFASHLATGQSASIKADSWETEVERFFKTMEHADRQLASAALDDSKAQQLLQGPLSDALTHVGQLAMLRRLAGSPIAAENFMKADITAGKLRYFQQEEGTA
ncbi:hypothetical protein XYCOK13_24260 [Xylanibacillus composti]|uniref:DinB family protein n=1 Tax=Xylanibacillus composti TaxID=1572762 RepID=A0A8J4H281_9BACL|nr:hypothetical protein [Xylanibacillus composti]GIQ69602.1 hypothetical protein XYCOK13_24260 [Xylanibacillus composti]